MGRRVSRRGLLQAGIISGVAFQIAPLGGPAHAALIEDARDARPSWVGPNGRPRFRMDAVAKVTGDKSFSRDYRSVDMPGWPSAQSHAFFIHAGRADYVFEGVDLSALGDDLQPDRLVLGDELARDGLFPPQEGNGSPPGFYGDVFIVPKGQMPRLLGQPVALLIYHDFARFDAAKRRIRFDTSVVKWGAQTGPRFSPRRPPAGHARLHRPADRPGDRRPRQLPSRDVGRPRPRRNNLRRKSDAAKHRQMTPSLAFDRSP